MFLFIGRRLLEALPILFGVSLVVFGLVHIVPGNPVDLLVPPEAPADVVQRLKAEFGFDKPLYIQYAAWFVRTLSGDFGLSVFNSQPVAGQLMEALGNTFRLAVLAALLGFAAGIGLGLMAALNHGRWWDKLFAGLAITGVSLPHYWCAIVLVLVFSVFLNWLPAQGM
ncbi:MAG: ABC transporter permease, partial [Proteobacteria bacterium]|nr:ABC transporter permease [Pseudomonadota bacterium]